MAKVTVNSGVCGFSTTITVSSEDMQNATVRIATACPDLKPLEAAPLAVDGYVECFGRIGETSVFALVREHCRHPGCPVPSGVIKGVEVACGLALPRDAEIRIENDR